MAQQAAPWLSVRGLSKHFGGARALSAVDVDIHRGEVHGLVGANGAGKSTLIRCLAGVVQPDEGVVSVAGSEVRIDHPSDAERVGFAFIHQELNLVPQFSSIDNILLGAQKKARFGFLDRKQMRATAAAAAERVGIKFSLDKRVDELSTAERWLVMISKALVHDVTMIAMDEPTASLSEVESENLFKIVNDLVADGVAILYVSHRLDEVLRLSDRITVFRDGNVVHRATRGEIDKRGLIRAIVGSDVEIPERERGVVVDRGVPPVFETRGICRGNVVRDISMCLYPGEVLGLGGLIGAGRTEFARIAFGADKPDAGTLIVAGSQMRPGSIPRAVAHGIGLVPEERRSEGLILTKSVAYNMNLAVLRQLRVSPILPFVSLKKCRDRALELLARLSIKTSGPSQQIGALSGGNQQKALIARWLTPGVKVLFCDELSRGVDVGARQQIHDAIRELAKRGVGVVVISSDVEELATLCDRVIVMREGEVSGELVGDDVTECRIIELSYALPDELARDAT